MNSGDAKTIVQFGAGSIGRSLVGQLFSRAGYRVIFIDVDSHIIGALNERGSYVVRVKDDRPEAIRVDNVGGIRADDRPAVVRAVSEADLLATAVGPQALMKVLPLVAEGIKAKGTATSLILCENLRGAAALARAELRRHLPRDFDLDRRLGLVETSIGKMVPIMPEEVRRRDPLEVWAEAYNLIIADRRGFAGEPPNVPGLVLKENFEAYVDRKLFIHNLGHAAAAWQGHLKGKRFVWECMEEPEVREETLGAMWEAGRALIRRYPNEFDAANQTEHIEDLLRRFGNRALNDTVYRVGRDLHRKLAPDDRCVGALRLCIEQAVEPAHILRTIAAGLRFRGCDERGELFPRDEEFQRQAQARGLDWILREVCGLNRPEDAQWREAILDEFTAMGGRLKGASG